jgi:hypothetical protein
LLKKKQNLPDLHSTRANIMWAFALQVIEKGAGYVILAVLTRTLLQEELGGMFFAVSIARLAAVTLSLGTDSHMIRKVANAPPNSLLYLSQNLSLSSAGQTRLRICIGRLSRLNLDESRGPPPGETLRDEAAIINRRAFLLRRDQRSARASSPTSIFWIWHPRF